MTIAETVRRARLLPRLLIALMLSLTLHVLLALIDHIIYFPLDVLQTARIRRRQSMREFIERVRAGLKR